MAGKKQHFIPQHFLKPFVIPGSRDHLWMYRRGQTSPVAVARSDAAAQNYFYSRSSRDGQPTLDDLITSYESYLHVIVDEIRRLNIGDTIDGLKIAEIVLHLMVRSSHIRHTLNEAILAILNSIEGLFCGEPDVSFVDLRPHCPPELIYHVISSELAKTGLTEYSPITEKTLIDFLYLTMREKSFDAIDEMLPLFAETLDGLRTQATELSRQAQVDALGRMMAPEKRVAELGNLIWQVVPAPYEGAVIPDCTSLAFTGRQWQPLLLTASDELEAVVLPLAPDRLALGMLAHDLHPDLSQYNRYAADSSYAFFLANYNSEELSESTGRLGGLIESSFQMMAEHAVVAAMGDLFRYKNDENRQEAKSCAESTTWNSIMTDERLQYSVTLADFGDEQLARKIAEEINSTVIMFSKYYPISSLEGFLFANDYKGALNRTDRGIGLVRDINPSESTEFIGIGMPLAVMGDGLIKTRIVLRASVAHNLISENTSFAEDARHVIVYMLASSALRGLIAAKFPSQILKPVYDQFEAFLHDYASGLFESYFCAMLATRNEGELENWENLALTSLRIAFEEIPTKRREYICGGSLETFFTDSANLTVNALSLLAALFGAYKGMDRMIPRSSAVLTLLSDHGLADWARLFSADLTAFEIKLDAWAEFEELFFVHRHFQRLLAHFGIVLDRHGGPGAYVHVPWIASDTSNFVEGIE